MKKFQNIAKAIPYLLFYICLQMIVQMCFVFLAQVRGEDVEQIINNSILMATLIANLFFIILLTIFFRVRRKKLLHEIKAGSVSARAFLLPVLCSFSYSAFLSMIFYNMTFSNSKAIMNSAEYYSGIIPGSGGFLCIISVLVLSPVTEEILFRGLLVTRMKRSVTAKAAIIISSLLFGVVHMAAGGFILVIAACISGFIFAIIYEATGSLLPAIGAHIAANIPDFLLIILPQLTNILRFIVGAGFFALFVFAIFIMIKRQSNLRKMIKHLSRSD